MLDKGRFVSIGLCVRTSSELLPRPIAWQAE